MPTSISKPLREAATSGTLKSALISEAHALGFDDIGFADPGGTGQAGAFLQRFIEDGWHGDMGWLEDKWRLRARPAALWPEVKSVVVVAMNYGPAQDPMAKLAAGQNGNISVYAHGRDYHDVLKKRLKRLGRWLIERAGGEIKVFVDTAPVLEKPLAAAAGLGWQGKHTNLVSRRYGSWLFLGALFTDLDFAPDTAHGDRCGHCRRCLDVCPTDAFPAPYRLDARRCISYLTIEHKGHIAEEFRAAMGNRIFGCDDCLAVCPWNKFAQAAREQAYWPRQALDAPLLADLARLDDAGFRELFSKSPVKRLGRARFLRNVLIAIGNSAVPALAAAAVSNLDDPSALVRAMAVWALRRLASDDEFAALKRDHGASESDLDVLQEWHAV